MAIIVISSIVAAHASELAPSLSLSLPLCVHTTITHRNGDNHRRLAETRTATPPPTFVEYETNSATFRGGASVRGCGFVFFFSKDFLRILVAKFFSTSLIRNDATRTQTDTVLVEIAINQVCGYLLSWRNVNFST